MTFIGIDPGAKGALAVVQKGDVAKMLIGVYPFSLESYRAVLADLKKSGEDLLAAVEDVHAMPKQGVSSMFSFGRSKGLVEGMLVAFDISYMLVRPQDWKKFHGICAGKCADKKAIKRISIAKAHQIYRAPGFYPTKRSRVESDGMAEATLIADYIAEKYFAEKRKREGMDRV